MFQRPRIIKALLYITLRQVRSIVPTYKNFLINIQEVLELSLKKKKKTLVITE